MGHIKGLQKGVLNILFKFSKNIFEDFKIAGLITGWFVILLIK